MPRIIAADGTKLHYDDDGRGPPVLCLAGLTRSGRDFDFVAPHLDAVRLIRMDYRGRGRSDPADPATYTIATEARDVLALLDHLDLDRVAILGTSRGGLIAMTLAATAPGRLSGICLNDIGPEIAAEGMAHIMGYLGHPPPQRTLDEAARAMATGQPGFEDVPVQRWRAHAERLFTKTPGGLALTYDPRLREAVEAAGAQPAPDLWPLFDAMEGLPLALIRGANSRLLTRDTVAGMRRRRPDMMFAEVPGRGHVPFLDEPEALDLLQRWIAAL